MVFKVLFIFNLTNFLFILTFTAIYSPIAFRFFAELAKLEQEKQDSWYRLFGHVADLIINIFTVFSFATKSRELRKIQDYYDNIHNPITIKYYRYDFIISLILCLFYWVFLISLFCYVIYLRNNGEISIGDIAFIMSLTFLFTENYNFENWSVVSVSATLYLSLFGSVAAFFAYHYALTKVSPVQVSILAYVNTIISIFLSWLILNETISAKFIVAAVLIILGVFIVNYKKKEKKAFESEV